MSKITNRNFKKRYKKELRVKMIVTCLITLVISLKFSAVAYDTGKKSLMDLLTVVFEDMAVQPFNFFPLDLKTFAIFWIIPLVAYASFYQEYVKKINTMFENAHGSGGFNEDLAEYYRDYLYDPNIVGGKIIKNEEGKNVSSKKDIITNNPNTLGTKVHYALRMANPITARNTISYENRDAAMMYSQIYSQKVYLSLNCKYTRRNLNAFYLGASGTGKSRFAVKPNILQANSSYVVTDPSGEILKDCGGFLKKEGYTIKVLNLKDMAQSCRYNPFQYVQEEDDIPVMVNCLKNNIEGPRKSGGDGKFWDQSTIALLVACCGYLYEVYTEDEEFLYDKDGNKIPEVDITTGEYVYAIDDEGNYILDEKGEKILHYKRNPYWKGHRNFTNVMNMLRMAQIDETGEESYNDLDTLFANWEEENPKSYAVKQYKTFKMAPGKTALNILISTAVLLGTYFDLDKFTNLTYKDEMDIESIGRQKTAVFIITPEGTNTYNFIAAMFYTQLFQVLYRQGEDNATKNKGGDPELEVPLRVFLDEMANIGSVPEFNEKLATMRKYRISAVPIFQSLAQLKKCFKDDWEVVIGNCDTLVFLGGCEPSEVKMLSERLGKMSIKTFSYTDSFGRSGGGSDQRSEIGRNVLDTNEIEQMRDNEQLIFIRGVRPFCTEKYAYEDHPNYEYTAGANSNYFYSTEKFRLILDDIDISSIMIANPNEEGYERPKYKGKRYIHGKKENVDSINARMEKAKQKNKSLEEQAIEEEQAQAQENNKEANELRNRAEGSKLQNMVPTQNEKIRIDEVIKQIPDNMNVSPEELAHLTNLTEEELMKKIELAKGFSPTHEFDNDDFYVAND